MGYTHYFNHEQLSQDKWDNLTKDVKELFVDSKDTIQLNDDDSDFPKVNGDIIFFNGIANDGGETFVFTRKRQNTFCKTFQRPYDKYVVAVLLLAKLHFGDEVNVRTDGNKSDWKKGFDLVNELKPNIKDFSFDSRQLEIKS